MVIVLLVRIIVGLKIGVCCRVTFGDIFWSYQRWRMIFTNTRNRTVFITTKYKNHKRTNRCWLYCFFACVCTFLICSYLNLLCEKLFWATEHNNIIKTIWMRYVIHSCSKLYFTSIDQLGLNEIGMSLRSKFKYEHTKNVQTQAKKK